jgi:hypothetical protein
MSDEATEPTCSVDGCEGRPHARGWCDTHYRRWRRKGSVKDRLSLKGVRCSINDCEQDTYARTWCHKHYQQWRSTGHPLRYKRRGPAKIRFWKYVQRSADNVCWLWTGARNDNGYGHLYAEGRMVYAHRLSWELHNGAEVSPDLEVMHACDNPPCVNPGHLSVGTQADNMADMIRKGRGRNARAS